MKRSNRDDRVRRVIRRRQRIKRFKLAPRTCLMVISYSISLEEVYKENYIIIRLFAINRNIEYSYVSLYRKKRRKKKRNVKMGPKRYILHS